MIHRKDHDGVAVLRMEHGKANAVDAKLFSELGDKLDQAAADSSVRAVVLTGSGKIFSAGVDLFQVTNGGPEYLEKFLPYISARVCQIFELPLPVVAAINGHAIAGGAVLAMAADRRLMADGKGRIGLTELLVGVPFPTAALEAMRAAVSGATLHDLILTGKTVLPNDALGLGMVDEVVTPEDLEARAVEAAAMLGKIPRDAFRLTKAHLRQPVLERIRRLEPEIDAQVLEIWSRQETLDGISRFLEATVGKK